MLLEIRQIWRVSVMGSRLSGKMVHGLGLLAEEPQWEKVVEDYREKKISKTHGDIPVERVASAIAYMHFKLHLSGNAIIEYFGEHATWFNWICHWAKLHPDARKLFSFQASNDRLSLVNILSLNALRPEIQPQGALNLMKCARKRR